MTVKEITNIFITVNLHFCKYIKIPLFILMAAYDPHFVLMF